MTHRKTTGDSNTWTFDVLTVGRYNAELWYTCPEVDARATVIPAGISGHKSNQMLDRLDKDVLAKKTDEITLSCGVNDVLHGTNGVPLDAYQKNITTIVDRAQATGIRVMILTATMIRENASTRENQKLAPYNDFLRQLAAEKKCLIADLNADMQAALKPGKHREPMQEETDTAFESLL